VVVRGRTAVIVDDGIATGSTALAACQVVRALGAARIVLATPVAPPGALAQLKAVVDEVVCLASPEVFFAIGEFYSDFAQVPDEEVVSLLRRGRHDVPPRSGDVEVRAGGVTLEGRLSLPEGARGLVVFAHGSGSSRHSPRNRYVASVLHEAGLGTLLFDLLTPAEQSDRANVFDIPLLAGRLVAAVEWVRGRPGAADVRVGLFGASTGAAAALWAAAEPGNRIAAVVSRGGRQDLAAARLAEVQAPTLLVVGGNDEVVLDLNRRAQALMRCETDLRVVPGATHLFEEPGALEAVAAMARDWFAGHLTTGDPARAPQPA
ncbi:MAG TPA: phosphoribosyltransferase family protein, partial [Candidatus Eisenbacteria bacterium]|nr:phosphoribosyltransferase family protein [Candidatus Eisenbacteria bacterium]